MGLKQKRAAARLAAAILILLMAGATSCLRKAPAPAAPAPLVSPQPQWDRVFTRTSGWTGADVAASFIIPGGRALWVFGDTWVGEVENNRHARATLVNNSIAIEPYDPSRPGTPPAPESVRFFWGPPDDAGKPTAWVRPAESTVAAASWYWPTGGGVVFAGPDRGFRLALFLIRLEKKPGVDPVWGFQCVGSAVAMIDNVAAPAEAWTTRVIVLPHQIAGIAEASDGQVDWGAAALLDSSGAGAPGLIYIYGVRSAEANRKDLVLARARPDRFEQFAAWEFFGGEGKWLDSPGLMVPLIRNVATELSVDKIFVAGRVHYLMVASEAGLGDRILARVADRPEGPWPEARPIFSVPEVQGSQTLFAYAAKGHAALSEPGTLLISYIVNTHDFTELVNNASIYRPRFIVASLRDLGLPD